VQGIGRDPVSECLIVVSRPRPGIAVRDPPRRFVRYLRWNPLLGSQKTISPYPRRRDMPTRTYYSL
jgi:hypothetical protein